MTMMEKTVQYKSVSATPVRYMCNGINCPGWWVNPFYIENRAINSWAVMYNGLCLNTATLHMEHEPSPSNRSDGYLIRHRFDSPEMAIEFILRNAERIK